MAAGTAEHQAMLAELSALKADELAKVLQAWKVSLRSDAAKGDGIIIPEKAIASAMGGMVFAQGSFGSAPSKKSEVPPFLQQPFHPISGQSGVVATDAMAAQLTSPNDDPTEEELTALKLQVIQLLQGQVSDSPSEHLAYIRERLAGIGTAHAGT